MNIIHYILIYPFAAFGLFVASGAIAYRFKQRRADDRLQRDIKAFERLKAKYSPKTRTNAKD